MGYENYLKALKLGQEAFETATAKGQYPYLPVLDEILSHADIECEVKLGTVDIPLKQVIGTCTAGRTKAFASNFMPLLNLGSEFSHKWANLFDAQVEEGIHDAVKVYEYMNKYYVLEGNKRVSVLKYFDAPTILADVIRKVPRRTSDPENRAYYEYMSFYNLTKINYVQFSTPGDYSKLLTLLGKDTDHEWTQDERRDFASLHALFSKAFSDKGGNKLTHVTNDTALLFFLSLYPYEEAKEMLPGEIRKKLNKIWPDITLIGDEDSVELLMDPTEEKMTVNTVLNKIIPMKRKRVAFVYDKEPAASNWIYGHELGRLHIDEVLGRLIETKAFITNGIHDETEDLLEEICQEGYDIIFAATPQLIKACLKVAAAHPDVKVLNCSLNSTHSSVRTYYTRMYEAKFLTGMIAGAMCSNNKIGYVADYPIYGIAANINAFALGAKMVNPRAKVYLAWSTLKDFDIDEYFHKEDISYISAQDMITPQSDVRQFGLYIDEDHEKTNLALSIYHWGAFYEKLINSIISGSWKSEDTGETKALNYWWGLSANVIDVICSNNIPGSTLKLINLMKKAISEGVFYPFTGPLTDQQGQLRCKASEIIIPEDLMTMDWLAENVIGSIPIIDELKEEAKPIVQLRGLDMTTPDEGGPSLL